MAFDPESAVAVAPDAPATNPESSFDPGSAKLVLPEFGPVGDTVDPTTAKVAPATSAFDASSAKPVADSPEQLDENFKAQWANSKSWVDRLGLYGKYFSNPWARYKQSVEQGMERPAVLAELPKIETTKDTNIVGQATAPVANAATGLVDFAQTAGGASIIANPLALAYATPFFAAETWDAAKKSFVDFAGAITGEHPKTTGELSQDVVNLAINSLATIGGGLHAAKGSAHVIRDASGMPKIEPGPVTDLASPVPPKLSEDQGRLASDNAVVDQFTREHPVAPVEGAQFNPATAEPVASNDFVRYQQIQNEMRALLKEDKSQTPEFRKLWAENEAIKNRNPEDPGMPPRAPMTADEIDRANRLAAEIAQEQVDAAATEAPTEPVSIPSRESPLPEDRPIEASTKPLTAAERELMRSEEASNFTPPGPELLDVIRKIKLPRPEDSNILKGELQSIYDNLVTETKVAERKANVAKKGRAAYTRKNVAAADQLFAKKGQGRALDMLRQTVNEQGFNFQTPDELLNAIDSANRGHKLYGQPTEAGTGQPIVVRPSAGARIVTDLSRTAKSEPKAPLTGLSKAAADARARIEARMRKGKLNANLDPAEIRDYAIITADYIAGGITDAAKLGKRLVDEFGEAVQDDLPAIIAQARELQKEQAVQNLEPAGAQQSLPGVPSPAPAGDSSEYGIAARVSEARAAEGNIASVEPGAGIAPADSVAHGRDLLESGRSPQAVIDKFNKDDGITADGIALVRAYGETLAKTAADAAENFGPESKEYQAAKQADSDWIKAIKPLQTEWAKIGQAQQGSTEIDTGTFHGLVRAVEDATGESITPEQARQAKEISGNVKTITAEAKAATDKVFKLVSEGPEVPPEVKSLSDRIIAALDREANSALERFKARREKGQVSSGLNPEDIADAVRYGAAKLAKGVLEKSQWAAEMVRDMGEEIRPYIDELWQKAQASLDKTINEMVKPERRKAVREVIKPEPKELTQTQEVWQRAKKYVDAGETDYEEVRHKIAVDMGLTMEEVTQRLTEPKQAARLTNEMYEKLARRRQLVQNAKSWIQNQATPGWLRFIRAVPRVFFIDKVIGHGTVGMVTHAGLNVFHPSAWAEYFPAFAQQFKLLGWHDKGAYHERMMQQLIKDPNYTTARRAGLSNDPQLYFDDYQSTWIGDYLQKIGLTGNRGFDALKIFRQARFNQIWNAFPESMQTADNAKLVADSINHATGVVKMRFGDWSNWTFFAPKLEGSRWAWMLGDPLKAGRTLIDWDKASPGEKAFALREVQQKATIAGVYLSLLALNQGLLTATGSNQQINVTNPRRSDFLAFKAGGYKFGVVSPMLGMVRLFANLIHDSVGKRGPVESMTPRFASFGEDTAQYVRGKASPFAGFAADVISQSDFAGRPLPFSNDRVPAYLRRQGVKKYTYGEYAALQFTPIPVSEAIRESLAKQGMNDSEIEHYLKAITSGLVMGATGARMGLDAHIEKRR
jgi:hypothetical protein